MSMRSESTITRILLLRHAETSAPDRFHGSESDVGLSATGFEQARRAGALLAARRPDVLYSSNLLRARQTAREIGRACGLETTIVPDLRERGMGPLSGSIRAETLPIYEAAKSRWAAGELEHTHDGGESYAAMRARLIPALQAIALAHPGRVVVVVAHGVAIRVLLTSLVEGFTPADFGSVSIDHVKVHELLYDTARWRIASEADQNS